MGDAGTFTYLCVSSWSAAQKASSWCSSGHVIFLLPDCGGFDLVEDINVDVAYFYYYDRDTGTLVGIGYTGFTGQWSCIGGTITPVDTSKCASSAPCFMPPDGGSG